MVIEKQRIELIYDGEGLTIKAQGIPIALAIWMLEKAKISLLMGAGKRVPSIPGVDLRGLDFSLQPRRKA